MLFLLEQADRPRRFRISNYPHTIFPKKCNLYNLFRIHRISNAIYKQCRYIRAHYTLEWRYCFNFSFHVGRPLELIHAKWRALCAHLTINLSGTPKCLLHKIENLGDCPP